VVELSKCQKSFSEEGGDDDEVCDRNLSTATSEPTSVFDVRDIDIDPETRLFSGQ
jgi:hypothetical protein